MRLPALVLACLTTMLSLPLRAQDEAGRTEADTADRSMDPVYANHIAGEFTPAKGFDIVKTKRASLNISFYGLFRYMNQSAGRPDVHRPPGPGARGQGAQRPQLAPDLRLAHRLLLRPQVPLQHLALVAADDAADPAVRQPPVQVQSGPRRRRRDRTEPHGALDAGLLALLGLQRPADGRGLLSRRVLVRRLRHRAAASRSSGTPPRSTPTSASSVPPPPTTRATWRTAPASSGGRRTGEFGPRGGLGDFEYHSKLATQFGASAAHSREVALRLGNRSTQRHPDQALRRAQPVRCRRAGPRGDGAEARLRRSWPSMPASSIAASRSRASSTSASSPTSWPPAPSPLDVIVDKGFQVQGMHMVVPRLVGVYLTYGEGLRRLRPEPLGGFRRGAALPEPDPQLAAQPPPHQDREEPGGVELRVLHLGPERHDHFHRDGHPAVRSAVL